MSAHPDYGAVAEFRAALRRFLHASDRITRAHDFSPATYDLLVMIAAAGADGATITSLAERLCLAANSVTELVNRAETAGLVQRGADAADGRITRVTMTRNGERRLASAVSALDADRLHLLRLLADVRTRLRFPDAPDAPRRARRVADL